MGRFSMGRKVKMCRLECQRENSVYFGKYEDERLQ